MLLQVFRFPEFVRVCHRRLLLRSGGKRWKGGRKSRAIMTGRTPNGKCVQVVFMPLLLEGLPLGKPCPGPLWNLYLPHAAEDNAGLFQQPGRIAMAIVKTRIRNHSRKASGLFRTE